MKNLIQRGALMSVVLAGLGFSSAASAADGRGGEGYHGNRVAQVKVEVSQLGHGGRGRGEGRGDRRDYDRGCEKPSMRRGHARGNFIYVRPGRKVIIIRGGDSCNERRRDNCH